MSCSGQNTEEGFKEQKLLDALLGREPACSLVYKRAGGQELRLYYEKPAHWSPNGNYTALVWIHGGGWKSDSASRFFPHCLYYAQKGLVTFSVDYRLAGSEDGGRLTSVEECLEDVKDAMGYIRSHAREFAIHPDRILAGGDSAGGHLAACLGLSEAGGDANVAVPYTANGLIICNGVTDLTGKWKKQVLAFDYPGTLPASIYPQEGEPVYELNEHEPQARSFFMADARARALSPVYQVERGHPPVFILHGLLDTVVEPEDGIHYYRALKTQGADVELCLIPDVSHAFILFNYKVDNRRILSFLRVIDGFLKKRGFLPD